MRVVFCIFLAELLSVVGYHVWISIGAVGCILKTYAAVILSAVVLTVLCGLKLQWISD